MLRYLIWIIFPAALPAQGALDGYLKGKGNLDVAPSFSFNNARTFEGAGGQRYAERYSGQYLGLFAAYGLSKRIDVVASLAAVFTRTQSGLQDGAIYLKYRPLYIPVGAPGRVSVLTGAGCTFPVGKYTPTATGAIGQRAITLPLAGILQWESPWGVFLNGTATYYIRMDKLKAGDIALVRQQRPDYSPVDPQHYSTFLLKTGFPARHFYADAWVEWQRSRGGVDYAPGMIDLPQAYAVSYTQIGGTIYYSDSGKNGFYLGWGRILKGRNVSLVQRITFGLVLKW